MRTSRFPNRGGLCATAAVDARRAGWYVLLATIARRRPDLEDPSELVPNGWDELAAAIKRFVDVGTTKFVVLPVDDLPEAADRLGAG